MISPVVLQRLIRGLLLMASVAVAIAVCRRYATRGGELARQDVAWARPGEVVDIGEGAGELNSAAVVLVEFIDFECAYCRHYASATLPLVQEHYVRQGRIGYLVRQMPLRAVHPMAEQAAIAAVCARAQGKLWAMHEALFKEPQRLDTAALLEDATSSDLDVPRYKACVSGAGRSIVADQGEKARQAGVFATPTFMIGALTRAHYLEVAVTLTGDLPYSTFKTAIESVLARRWQHGG
jgi:protein-disulfide isomerase